MMIRMVRVAPRPGVFSGFLVSSFMVKTASQPQNMKMESEIPAANSEKSLIARGLNHSKLTGLGSTPEPFFACTSAATAKPTRINTWKVTKKYWTFWVVSKPRYATHAAIAVNISVVGILIHKFSVQAAIFGFPKICDNKI